MGYEHAQCWRAYQARRMNFTSAHSLAEEHLGPDCCWVSHTGFASMCKRQAMIRLFRPSLHDGLHLSLRPRGNRAQLTPSWLALRIFKSPTSRSHGLTSDPKGISRQSKDADDFPEEDCQR